MSSAGLSTRRCLRTAKITFFSRDFLFRIYEYPKFLLTMWNYLQLSFSTTWYFNISCTSGHEPNLSHRLSYGKMFPKTCLNKIVVSSLSSRRPNFQQDSWNLACIIILKKKKIHARVIQNAARSANWCVSCKLLFKHNIQVVFTFMFTPCILVN